MNVDQNLVGVSDGGAGTPACGSGAIFFIAAGVRNHRHKARCQNHRALLVPEPDT